MYESEICKVQKTSDKWKDFLDFAAKAQISKMQNEFEFSTKLIIHAINPKATDCRVFGEWKTQDGNHVNYGEHGITVLSRDSRGNQSVTYLFDTSQTALKKEPELLEIPEEIMEKLKSALSSMIEKFSNNATFSDEQKRIFKASAEYKLCKQYELGTNDNAELFSGIEKLSVKEIANIGVSLNRCSQSFYEVVNNERRNFYDAHRINDSQSRNDRTELHGRESRRMDLGGGSSDAHEEVRLKRGAERVEQAERGTGSVRADVLDTSAEADSGNGQVRQHETEIHMANSLPDRGDNAERGTGGRGEPTESSLRGNERTSSEPDRRDSGEETVGGIQDDRGIGTIPAESTNTGEIQGRSGGGNTSSDSLRNITNETAEPEKVSAVSFSEKVHAAFAEVAENHVYSAKQQKFLDRLENFIVKRQITENLIDEMAKLPAFHMHYNNRNTLSRSVFAGRLGSLEREMMQALKRQLREDAMDKAIRLIHEYCESEFDTKANLSNMDHIDIAYTTDEYSELPIEVYVDLETFRIVKEYDSVVVSETLYNSLEDMHGDLANLAVDELVALSDEEKDMVITAEKKVDTSINFSEKEFADFAYNVIRDNEIVRNAHVNSDRQEYQMEVRAAIDSLVTDLIAGQQEIEGYTMAEISAFANEFHENETLRNQIYDSIAERVNTALTRLEETRQKAQELGIPFSNEFSNGVDDELDPYVFDGSMSPKDFRKMQLLNKLAEITNADNDTLYRLIETFDMLASPDFENILYKQNQIKVALYNILDNDEYALKAFYTIADMKYGVKISNEQPLPTVDDLSAGDIIFYDGKCREVEQIDEKRISLKDLDSPNFGGILLGTSDVYSYADWQQDMNNKGFEILSKAKENKKAKFFSSVDFEKKIPKEMMFKETYIFKKKKALYWVTQEIFTEADLDKFQAALKDTKIEKAYVIPRDFSGYSFEVDMARNAPFAIVTKDSISCKDYIDKVKSVYNYDVSKQQEEKKYRPKFKATCICPYRSRNHKGYVPNRKSRYIYCQG